MKLDELERRGRENGVPGLRRLAADEISEIEPHAVGVGALFSPDTGIVDFAAVARTMADEIRAAGATIQTGVDVHRLSRSNGTTIVHTSEGPIPDRRARSPAPASGPTASPSPPANPTTSGSSPSEGAT